MGQNRTLSQNVFMVIAAFISWFAILFEYIQATSTLLGESEFPLYSPMEFFTFMTIWTNLLIAFAFTLPLISRQWKISRFFSRPDVLSFFLVYIIIVSISYHVMLSDLWDPKGLRKVTDLLLHYFIPIIFFIYWFSFVKHNAFKFNRIHWLLIYPIVYAIIILIKGAITDKYPYPFIDVTALGYPAVLFTFFIFLVFYYFLGIIIWAIDRLIYKVI